MDRARGGHRRARGGADRARILSEAWQEILEPPRAGTVVSSARVRIKETPEGFAVRELPAHAPSGEGEHLWVELERAGMNTEHVARVLARAAGIAPRDVGYAGLKDRHALVRQWFSVPWRGDLDALAERLRADGVETIGGAPNARKLRRGALAGNRFRIHVAGADVGRARLDEALARLRERGVPDYFGAQRFGRGGANLARARELLIEGTAVRDRHRRGLYLSAARAALFNRVLAARVRDGTWDRLLPGEAVALAGSASFFRSAEPDAELVARAAALDVHPSGPLWGRGEPPSAGTALAVERAALAGCEALMRGLERAGLDHARRPLRVAVSDLEAEAAPDGGWWLAFSLPAGAYATVVLGELFHVDAAAARADVPARARE